MSDENSSAAVAAPRPHTAEAPAGQPRIFVCHLVHSAPRQRGPGWYWWIEGADDFMTGPFNTEAECHSDIFLQSREAHE